MLLGLAIFLDGILASVEMTALALVLGGLGFGVLVLGLPERLVRLQPLAPSRPGANVTAASADLLAAAGARCAGLILWGCLALAGFQALHLVCKAVVIGHALGRSPLPDFFSTAVFEAGAARTALAVVAAGVAARVRRMPDAPGRWAGLGVAAAALLGAGAFTGHASGRMDDRGMLMTLTALHTLGGCVWAGGVLHLAGLWRLCRPGTAGGGPPASRPGRDLWQESLRRFAPLGLGSLALLIGSGVPLTVTYVGEPATLIGTAFGSMVISKWVLMAAALGLAWLNFRSARRGSRTTTGARDDARTTAVPFFVEAESLLLVALLFVAASLAALPPGVDIDDQRASWQEVAESFAPKMPRLVSPTLAEVREAEANSGVVPREEASAEEYWSDFNHNVSGVAVIIVGLMALIERTGRAPIFRHWPLGFLVLGAFIFVRSDNDSWPLGDQGFLEGLADPSTLEHKLSFLLTVGIGLLEWRARTATAPARWLPFMLPVLSITGGIILLTHAHGAFELKTEYLIQVSHTAMGVLAVLLGAGRWLEVRLPTPTGRMAGTLSMVCMVGVGVVLAFYREPLQ